MVKKRAILFDLDNTLYDYDVPHEKALIATYQKLKTEIKISRKKFNHLFKVSKEEIHRELAGTASAHNRILYFQRLIEKTHNTVHPSLILDLYYAYWNTFLKNTAEEKESTRLLKELKRGGYQIAIVSDMTTNIQLKKMKKLKITPYIDYLITSEEAGSEKPHSIMFLLALNKLGIKPEEAIMVGDNSVNDVEGANSVGIDTVLIKRGKLARKAKDDYKKPNYTIRSIGEVMNILNEVNKNK
jgi:putative hydrolase of the HAD superfamily